MSAATETIAFLRNYNSWRRGDETIEMPSPAEIGATIDDAVNLLRKYDDLKTRAERAEAELAEQKYIKRSAVKRANKLTEELATERARLDHLSTRGFEHRHHETGDHLGYEWTISSYSESKGVTLRDVIDAEMQEEAK